MQSSPVHRFIYFFSLSLSFAPTSCRGLPDQERQLVHTAPDETRGTFSRAGAPTGRNRPGLLKAPSWGPISATKEAKWKKKTRKKKPHYNRQTFWDQPPSTTGFSLRRLKGPSPSQLCLHPRGPTDSPPSPPQSLFCVPAKTNGRVPQLQRR